MKRWEGCVALLGRRSETLFFSGDICAESSVKKMDSAPLWEEYSKQRKSQVQFFGTCKLGRTLGQQRDSHIETWEAERGKKRL